MGGISVLVVLGLFMSFYALYLFLIFISIFYLVENYIFESLFLYNKTHSKKSWIPYYNKYLLGCVLLSFIMNIYISHQIIKKVYPKYGDWITVFNVLTLGFFRPISLFLVRNK